ncbi:DUF2894 domain-containing protein [Spongiibacter sp. KMU-158]|uniref:DUF2894 domain-containing protein n=1 Tax=Spongiibacter pelagi TaxID=2760804 RepID=A0A927C237_9GAMM|nr:DUF2894 domain-containing protein [Spongiibacter pelagi]MBD2858236.1 DUF2894 domain-containing protein [Spongiibacter pelagi]
MSGTPVGEVDNLKEQLHALQQRLTAISPAKSAIEVCHLNALLERAQSQLSRSRFAVAEKLIQRIALRLDDLSLDESSAEHAVAESSLLPQSPSSSELHAILQLLEPEQYFPEKASIGLAFDEYLRQQESEVLQAWAGESGEGESGDVQLPNFSKQGEQGLKAARWFEEQRLKRYASSLVNKAIEEAPEDPGPLNPQMLAIKSLMQMRDLSTHYLNRFVSYVDSMLYLELAMQNTEPAKKAKAAPTKKATPTKSAANSATAKRGAVKKRRD